jgi:tRNA (mo5U34)-methyltransferase
MGDYPLDRWKAIEPFVPKDLSGKTVLDLACNSGYFSVMMKRRGAKYVLGVDIPQAIEQAKFATGVLGDDVDYLAENIYTFALTNGKEFDFVLFLGLFYHLRHPLLVLDKAADWTREKLYFTTYLVGKQPAAGEAALTLKDDYPIDEFAVFDHADFPKMFFIEKSFNGDSTNWWFPNEPCVWAVLRSAGFRTIRKVESEISGQCFVCDAPARIPADDFDSNWLRCPSFPSQGLPRAAGSSSPARQRGTGKGKRGASKEKGIPRKVDSKASPEVSRTQRKKG